MLQDFDGNVLKAERTTLDKQSKGISIDEQANNNVVHLRRFQASAAPSASVPGTRTSAPEERSVGGLRRHAK
jgi:hypothetical protein